MKCMSNNLLWNWNKPKDSYEYGKIRGITYPRASEWCLAIDGMPFGVLYSNEKEDIYKNGYMLSLRMFSQAI